MLPLELLERLHRSPEIFQALREATGDELDVQKQLRSRFPAELVRGACAIDELRHRASAKFSRADHMWFDRAGLEQSTAEAVARHKARRFQGCVWDLCSGIGGDAIALGERGEVIAVDIDPVRARCAEWNAEAYSVADRITVQVGDVASQPWQGRLVHVDPDRRSRPGARARRIEEYAPGLETLRQLMTGAAGGAIKVSPAANFHHHFPGCEIELVSLHRECKEATVWFGSLAGEQHRRATVLPAGVSLTGDGEPSKVESSGLQRYLFDPDPAVVRAGLVNRLAAELGLCRLDEADEYLTSDTAAASPFLQRYAVEETSSVDEKRLRRWLQGHRIGRLEIKSRRLAVNHDALRRRLRLKGDREGTLVLTRVAGARTAVLCQREAP